MPLASPAVILYDVNGLPMAVSNGVALPAGTEGLTVAGLDDGSVSRFIRTFTDGTVRVDPTGTTIQPVSGTVTANQGTAAVVGNAWPIKVSDGVNTAALSLLAGLRALAVDNLVKAATATLTNVASSAANVTLLAANTNRRGFKIWNDSSKNLFVKFGAVATATSFTVKLTANAFLEDVQYQGQLDGIWDVANGAARVTELTI